MRAALRWLMIDGEPDAHCITRDDSSERGWRSLCQQSDLASDVLKRDARDGVDSFCPTCRHLLAARLRAALARKTTATKPARVEWCREHRRPFALCLKYRSRHAATDLREKEQQP